MFRRGLAIAAVVVVLVAYAFYGSRGTWRFLVGTWGQSYYAGLGEGFLSGRLSMALEPPEELKRLANPYDFHARGDLPVAWDASYFEGQYYLYFSPVPVVLFYIPVRLAAGGYPSDELAATVFAAIAFLILSALAWRARPSQLPLWLWIVFIGIGNVVPYVLVGALFYQVAIACAMMFTAAWAYSVMRFLEAPATRWAVAMGVFLAMAIATRPNLAVLLAVQLLIVLRHRRAMLQVAIPLLVMAGILGAYNYARFRSVFEFGVSYQLARAPMQGRTICGVCGPGEVPRLLNHATHYVFWPVIFHGKFPYVWVQNNKLDPNVSYPGGPEPIAGIAPVTPLVMVGTGLALLLGFRRSRTGAIFTIAGWLVLLALSACWWVTARYTLDFLVLLLAGTVLSVEGGLALLNARALRIACALLAIYSIVLGALLPISMPLFGR